MAETEGIGLVPGEQIISKTASGMLVLTSQRVRLNRRASGRTGLVSITLDSVASCGLVARSQPIFLIIAMVAAIGAIATMPLQQGMVGIAGFVAAVMVILYLVSRSVVLEISSAGESITITASGTSRDSFVTFINEIERAKIAMMAQSEHTRSKARPDIAGPAEATGSGRLDPVRADGT